VIGILDIVPRPGMRPAISVLLVRSCDVTPVFCGNFCPLVNEREKR
jgi:hypothetical protein